MIADTKCTRPAQGLSPQTPQNPGSWARYQTLTDAEADFHAARFQPSWAPSLPAPAQILAKGQCADQEDALAAARLLAHERRARRRAVGTVASIVGLLIGLTLLSFLGSASPPPRTRRRTTSELSQHTQVPKPLKYAKASPSTGTVLPRPRPASDWLLRGVSAGATHIAEPEENAIRLRVTTDPKSARIRVNGQQVGSPYDARVPAGAALMVEVSAPGYRPESRVILGDRSQTVGVALRRN